MNYGIQLQFVRDLLLGLHVSSHVAENPTQTISSNIDPGLRSMLFREENYVNLLHNSMSEARPNTIYRFFDEYHCNYIFLRLPDTEIEKFFYIGPYLPAPMSEERVRHKADSLTLATEQYSNLLKYYNNLPIIEDENLLFTIINTLANTLWGSSDNYSTEYIDYMIPDRAEPICVVPAYGDVKESPVSLSVLETHYANEKQLMDAVSQGKFHKVNVIASAVYNNGTEQRLSDSLRNRKNYLIILNTLLRKAAEQGGVHPLHIDRMSSTFARKIEEVYSIDYSLHLQSDMIREYCFLVKQYSISKFSYLVGKTQTLIAYDLTADLSLKNIAAQLNVSPTYLSALFRKECDITLTDYVNNKRMEHAIHLLNTTDKLINVISYECGIQDTNYFIKLFKRYTGLTPTKYREQQRK